MPWAAFFGPTTIVRDIRTIADATKALALAQFAADFTNLPKLPRAGSGRSLASGQT